MSEEIKFQYLIGNETNFKKLDDLTDSVIAIIQYGEDDFCCITDVNEIPKIEGNLIAMRRIIKTPLWTKADKEAGRFPEVGAKVCYLGIEYEVLATDKNSVCFIGVDKELYIASKSSCKPIETPEERAKREEDEFVDSNIVGVEFKDNSDLSFYRKGLRAAYRKLKMPEVQK